MEKPVAIADASTPRGPAPSAPISIPTSAFASSTGEDSVPRRSSSLVNMDTNTGASESTSAERTPIGGTHAEKEKDDESSSIGASASEKDITRATRRALAASLQRACSRPRTPVPPHSLTHSRAPSPFAIETAHLALHQQHNHLHHHQQPSQLQSVHNARLAFAAAKRSNSTPAVPFSFSASGSTRGPGSLLTPTASPALSLVGLPSSTLSASSIPQTYNYKQASADESQSKAEMTIPLSYFTQPHVMHPGWAWKDETEVSVVFRSSFIIIILLFPISSAPDAISGESLCATRLVLLLAPQRR